MVRIHPDPPGSACTAGRGAVAQLGEHLLCKQGVVGSIPSSSTNAPGARVTINEWRPRGQAAATPKGAVAVWFFNRNRLLFNNWEEANKRSTQSWSGAGLDCIDWPPL